ncbi:MAG: hypothetical protein LC121_21715 [Anaerolineae bacterium]|nr:hypothetical protein [Anaerolineae bacterium]
MSTINQIADAVVASLNAGSFSIPFTAERKYQPVHELSQLQELRVCVVPKSLAATIATRSDCFFDCAIDIGVQRKVDVDDLEVLDGLMHLVEEIGDHLRFHRLDAFPNAAWLSLENTPIFAPDHLEKERVFTSVLTVTYRVRR